MTHMHLYAYPITNLGQPYHVTAAFRSLGLAFRVFSTFVAMAFHARLSVFFLGYLFCLCCQETVQAGTPAGQYEVSDDLGIGKRFDGIGGISGGGVRTYHGSTLTYRISLFRLGYLKVTGQLSRTTTKPDFRLFVQGWCYILPL